MSIVTPFAHQFSPSLHLIVFLLIWSVVRFHIFCLLPHCIVIDAVPLGRYRYLSILRISLSVKWVFQNVTSLHRTLSATQTFQTTNSVGIFEEKVMHFKLVCVIYCWTQVDLFKCSDDFFAPYLLWNALLKIKFKVLWKSKLAKLHKMYTLIEPSFYTCGMLCAHKWSFIYLIVFFNCLLVQNTTFSILFFNCLPVQTFWLILCSFMWYLFHIKAAHLRVESIRAFFWMSSELFLYTGIPPKLLIGWLLPLLHGTGKEGRIGCCLAIWLP